MTDFATDASTESPSDVIAAMGSDWDQVIAADAAAEEALQAAAARRDWIKRFAYRAMLCNNGLDTESAMLIADVHHADSAEMEPETAAELYSGAPTVLTERRRSPETRRIFGEGKMQGLSDFPPHVEAMPRRRIAEVVRLRGGRNQEAAAAAA